MTAENALLGREERLTFKANLRNTRYGWLRLTPAYSVHLVRDLVEGVGPLDPVLDPFCGTGTTALVCAEQGLASLTTDINPFLTWLSEAKAAEYEPAHVLAFDRAAGLVETAMRDASARPEWLPALHQIDKWWDSATLHALGRGMATMRRLEQDLDDPVADLLRIAFCRVTIERAAVSFGHQSMSFKKRLEQESLFADEDMVDLAAASWTSAVRAIGFSARSPIRSEPRVLLCDARALTQQIERESIARVVTSPPYPNRMSYIRELRPYMYWLGYLSDGRAAGELDWRTIGGTWGSATSNVSKWQPTDDREIAFTGLETILEGISERSQTLSRYVHKYFFDMVEHVNELVQVMRPGSTASYIVGNSKFYDVLLPVERIYAGMFEAAGFVDVGIETIRKRSSKRELFEYVVTARKPG